MKRFGVIGNPIQHSLSPQIHQAFARQLGLGLTYEKILSDDAGFEAALRRFFEAGGEGLNVTLPFKLRAHAWVTEAVEDAAIAGAVNTIAREGGRFLGYNTDGVGLVVDLERIGVRLSGARVLLLGAGGAALGVLPALLRAGADRITVANRTPSRAAALVARVGEQRLHACEFGDLPGPYDLVINATSSGIDGERVPLSERILHGAVCYDMMYGPGAVFHRWALESGSESHDGLGMLVGQAAAAFHIWWGVQPDPRPVLERLREHV